MDLLLAQPTCSAHRRQSSGSTWGARIEQEAAHQARALGHRLERAAGMIRQASAEACPGAPRCRRCRAARRPSATSESAASSTAPRMSSSDRLMPSSSAVFSRMVSEISLGTVVTRLLSNRNGRESTALVRPEPTGQRPGLDDLVGAGNIADVEQIDRDEVVGAEVGRPADIVEGVGAGLAIDGDADGRAGAGGQRSQADAAELVALSFDPAPTVAATPLLFSRLPVKDDVPASWSTPAPPPKSALPFINRVARQRQGVAAAAEADVAGDAAVLDVEHVVARAELDLAGDRRRRLARCGGELAYGRAAGVGAEVDGGGVGSQGGRAVDADAAAVLDQRERCPTCRRSPPRSRRCRCERQGWCRCCGWW